MAAATKPPLPPPDVRAPAAAPIALRQSRNAQLRGRGSEVSTPAFLRSWNVALLVLIAAFAVVASVATLIMGSASRTTADNTAPALIGIQDLFASVAEANTAATAEFLSTRSTGTEDRVNRNLYADAIRRATEQTEEVSSIIGADETAHRALKDIGIALNAYSGRIEAARVANVNGLDGADTDLRAALALVSDEISPAVATVTAEGQAKLDAERTTGRLLAWLAIAIGAVTLAALLWVQRGLLRRTNRILNPLLALSTILIAVALAYLVVGPISRAQALDNASVGGYDAIAATSEIQTAAFDLQSQLSLRLVEGRDRNLDELITEVDTRIDGIAAGADSPREQAAADALRVRWERYWSAALAIDSLADQGDPGAVELYRSDGLSTFNGLNTAIESVLSDNRTQFSEGVDEAARYVSLDVGLTPWLEGLHPLATIILPVLAALFSLWAIQRRLAEYR